MARTGFYQKTQKKNTPISLKLPETMAQTLSKIAKERDLPESAIMREALTEYLKKEHTMNTPTPEISTFAKINLGKTEELTITPEMVELVKQADIPEAADFANKLLLAVSKADVHRIVFGKARDGGWECYDRDQDSQEGWNLDDALNFRNTLILKMMHPEMF